MPPEYHPIEIGGQHRPASNPRDVAYRAFSKRPWQLPFMQGDSQVIVEQHSASAVAANSAASSIFHSS